MSFIILHGETAVKHKVVQLSFFGTHIRHCLRIIDGTALVPLPRDLQNCFSFFSVVKTEGLTIVIPDSLRCSYRRILQTQNQQDVI